MKSYYDKEIISRSQIYSFWLVKLISISLLVTITSNSYLLVVIKWVHEESQTFPFIIAAKNRSFRALLLRKPDSLQDTLILNIVKQFNDCKVSLQWLL